jgi:hypothetical protein
MRHHNLPTRLLDWTSSILVAAYFAVEDQTRAKLPGAVWALATASFNCRERKREGKQEQKALFAAGHESITSLASPPFHSSAGPTSICAFVPVEIAPRMMVQQSAFTIHGRGELMQEMDGHEQFHCGFEIPPGAKSGLWEALRLVGICGSTLFPDLDHLATDLELELELELELRSARAEWDSEPPED